MFAESPAHLQDPSRNEQLPPIANPLLPSLCASIDIAQSMAPLRLLLGVPLRVDVEARDGRFFVRGNLEKLSWAAYEEISSGLRKLIASQLNVDVEALTTNKLMLVDVDHAKQYVEISIPACHAETFASADTRKQVGTYLNVLRGEQASDGSLSRFSKAVELAHQVREVIGGKTLPAACEITASCWNEPLQLAGKLGEKPHRPPSAPEDVVIDCHVDGYLKSQRVVHLLPVGGGSEEQRSAKRDGRKVVAFDEEKWFEQIANLAPKQGHVVRASYQRVPDGKKELLHLTDLAAVVNSESIATAAP